MSLSPSSVPGMERIPPGPQDKPSAEALPHGAREANWFGLFNALSWQITLGAPTILYAKGLGASATVLGVIAALTPLLVIFQIPAAHYLPQYGYRRFILGGWGTRTLFIFALAIVPLLTFLPAVARLGLVLACLFAFNLIRGIASGAWLPWMSELIPDHLRGRFLSRDQVFAQTGSLVALLLAAVCLRGQPGPWQFSLVFLVSAAGATTSLWFVRRIPDVTAPDALKRSGHRVPWKHMLLWPPFLRLLVFNVLWVIVAGSLGVFTIAFLKGVADYDEGTIIALSSLGVLGALASVWRVGQVLDRTGSAPVMRTCLAAFVVVVAGWWALAAGLVPAAVIVVAGLNLLGGIAGANFGVANSRLVMATMPLMGRNHFFALYTVITNLSMGLAPIVWGLLLDALGGFSAQTGPADWNRYSIYFALSAGLTMAALGYSVRLREKVVKVTAPAEPSAQSRAA